MTFSFFMAQGRSGVVVRFVPEADVVKIENIPTLYESCNNFELYTKLWL